MRYQFACGNKIRFHCVFSPQNRGLHKMHVKQDLEACSFMCMVSITPNHLPSCLNKLLYHHVSFTPLVINKKIESRIMFRNLWIVKSKLLWLTRKYSHHQKKRQRQKHLTSYRRTIGRKVRNTNVFNGSTKQYYYHKLSVLSHHLTKIITYFGTLVSKLYTSHLYRWAP